MIYKRGAVQWYRFKWSVKGNDGKRECFVIRKSAHTSSARKAREVEEEHRRALRLGLIHPLDVWPKVAAPEAPVFHKFTKQFLAYTTIQTKPGTLRFYTECVNRLLAYSPIADAVLTAITSELVSKYAQHRMETAKNTLVTVNGDLRTLRRMFSLADEWGLISRAPIIHELPGAQGRERVVSFTEEAKYLAAASRTVRDAAMLAVDTGMRPNSELFPLEWSDVHFECTPDEPHGLIHVRKGKTDSAVRNIPLTLRTREMLLARKQLLVGPKGQERPCGESKYVFPGEGNSGHLVTVQHAHEKAMRDAELKSFEFYCWRHTFGTRCAQSGMDRFAVARLMGHSSPHVAERYYIHVTESHVTAGFGKFMDYQARNIVEAFPEQSQRVQ